MVHGLAAQKFSDRRAQDRAAVRTARIGRGARTLELQLPMLAAAVPNLAERDGAAVAELTRPGSELVTAVTGGHRVHSRQEPIAREHFGELRAPYEVFGQPQNLRNLRRDCERARLLHGRRL